MTKGAIRAAAAAATAARLAAAAACISSGLGGAALAATNACESQIISAADRYGIPAGILYAVGLAETGRKGSLQPYALNIEGRAVFPATKSMAMTEFEAARRQGHELIDLGCMQINYRYHANAFRGVADMLDPARNVDYAARFLKTLKGQHDTWAMAVARYHAGPDNDPAQKRYVCKVIANLVATGFGKWTEPAQRFCR